MCECKVCRGTFHKEKKRVDDTGRIYYEDAKGRRWNGRSCPDCYQKKSNERLAELSTKRAYTASPKGRYKPRNNAEFDSTGAPAPKMRACRQCGRMSANYFRCPPCTTYQKSHHADLYDGCYDESMFGLSMPANTGAGFRF